MKSYFKKIVVALLVIILFAGLILTIGVLLHSETYKQKEQQFTDLLITNCNVVDVKNNKIIPNKQVLVQHGKIVFIDTVVTNFPRNCKVINAGGQYLMPSLWDMHLHTLSLSPQLHFPLLIANGVTGVRDMGDGDSWISEIDDNSTRDRTRWQRQAEEEELLIPKIIQSTSYHVEELEDIDEINYKTKVKELIEKLKARGESFVKVQLEEAELPDYVFYELQREAKSQGIPILGHLSPNLDISQVMDNGFKSIEHAWALIPHFTKIKSELRGDIEQKTYQLNNQDSEITKQILSKIAASDTYFCPTHVTSNRKEYLAFEPGFNEDPNTIYTENVQLLFWKMINWLHTKGYDEKTDLPVLKKYYERGLEITQVANQQGVKILAGTDALDRNVYYGISIHTELEEMVKAGLSNHEALMTATYNAADYYGMTNEYGSIETGKMADFILLRNNPLENITNTQTISAVFYNNRWYNEADLEAMKIFVSKQAKSFGISCKFIWNMLKGL
jgi:imidazolonepropionase-like amidohydrolase